MRYRLRTLLIVLALGPVVLAGAWWGVVAYREWRANVFVERTMEKWLQSPPGTPMPIQPAQELPPLMKTAHPCPNGRHYGRQQIMTHDRPFQSSENNFLRKCSPQLGLESTAQLARSLESTDKLS
jgi:hypothetical protein